MPGKSVYMIQENWRSPTETDSFKVVMGILGAVALASVVIGVVAKVRRVSLGVVIFVGCSLSICLTAMSTWLISISTIKETIDKEIEGQLRLSSDFLIKQISSELQIGMSAVQYLKQSYRTGALSLTMDRAFDFFNTYNTSLCAHGCESISSLYAATTSGWLFGVTRTISQDPRFVTMILAYPPNADLSPYEIACSPNMACGLIDCGKPSEWPPECPEGCANVSAAHCVSEFENCGLKLYSENKYPIEPVDFIVPYMYEGFDPRKRSWFKLNDTEGSWGSPYEYISHIDVAVPFHAAWGEAVFSVDFSLTSLRELLVLAKPSEHAVVHLVTPSGILVSTSVTYATTPMLLNTLNETQAEQVFYFPVCEVADTVGGLQNALNGTLFLVRKHDIILSRPIIIKNLEIIVIIALPYSDVMGEMDNSMTVALVIALAMCVTLGILLSLLLTMVLRPVRSLALMMASVSKFDLDKLEMAEDSLLTEIKLIQTSFTIMIEDLKIYKQYLPPAIVGWRSTEKSTVPPVKPASEFPNPLDASDWDAGSSASHGMGIDEIRCMKDPGYPPQGVSMVVTNIRKFNDVFSRDVDTGKEHHRLCLELILKTAHETKGMLDMFSGDKCWIAYNATYANAAHKICALRCGREAVDVCSTNDLHINTAVVTGTGYVGVFGTYGVSRLTLVGPIVTSGIVLERFGAYFNISVVASCGPPEKILEPITYKMIIDVLLPLSSELHRVIEVIRVAAVSVDSSILVYNAAFATYVTKSDPAQALAELHRAVLPEDRYPLEGFINEALGASVPPTGTPYMNLQNDEQHYAISYGSYGHR